MKTLRRIGLGLALILFCLTLGQPFLQPQSAYAATFQQQLAAEDISIEIQSGEHLYLYVGSSAYVFRDSDSLDNNHNYRLLDQTCEANISFDSSSFRSYTPGGTISYTLRYRYVQNSNGDNSCSDELTVTGATNPQTTQFPYSAFYLSDDVIYMPTTWTGGCSGLGGQSSDKRSVTNAIYKRWNPAEAGYSDSLYIIMDGSDYSISQSNEGVDKKESGGWLTTNPAQVWRKSVCGGTAENDGTEFFAVAPKGSAIPYPYRDSVTAMGATLDADGNITALSGNLNAGTPTEVPREETCESKGGVLGWILCPVILAMDSAMSWLDTQIQSLLEIDENKANNPGLKQAWQSIRNIAYIVLIPIMLVMVIGTALGIEVMSAYTVRKALPRMVIAIIFITLSWYITNFLITFFNVVGGGILGLLTNPFLFNGEPVGTLSLGDLFSAKFGGGFWQTVSANANLGLSIVVVVWLFLAPLALIILTAFVVLFLRQLFIVALSLLAPLAILAWIFPGNDKLWKMWWSAFSKLLIMFPLIMVIIAVGRIFAAILAGPFNDGGVDNWFLTPLFVLAAYVLPYAAIPLTFKAAGGIFANITGMMQGGEKGMFAKMRERRGQKIGRKTDPIKKRVTDARWGAATRLNRSASAAGGIRGMGLRGLSRMAGGYRPDEAQSAATAEAAKRFNDAVGSGPDNVHRALTAKWAMDRAEKEGWDGKTETEYARLKNGRRQYKTLGGAWSDEADVHEANRRWGKDRHFQQAALAYEMRKAMESGEGKDVENVRSHYVEQANSWGMNDLQAAGAWTGAAFQNQDQHLEFKHSSVGRDDATGQLKLNFDSGKMVQEMWEKRGSYNLSQMNAHTIGQLEVAYDGADASTADGQKLKQQIEDITRLFVSQGNQVVGMVGNEESQQPVMVSSGQPQQPTVHTQGAAAVQGAVQSLAKKTGLVP